MALFPQSLTFITCLSKCRIGDVFKHSFFYFLYLFRMYEEGGGQMTCYWYVLISLKLFLHVCIWEEMISLYSAYFEVHFQNQIKVVPNTKFSKFCLKSLMKNLLTDLQEWPEIVTKDTWFFTHIWEKNVYFAQCLGICGISWNQGVFLKGHFGEKTSLNPSQFLVLLKMVWHMHKDDGDRDFQSSLLSNIQFWQFYNPIPSHLEDFTDHGILCCKYSSPPGTTNIWHGVGISNFQSNMVWQNKMCGCSLAYGCNAFQKWEISKFVE